MEQINESKLLINTDPNFINGKSIGKYALLDGTPINLEDIFFTHHELFEEDKNVIHRNTRSAGQAVVPCAKGQVLVFNIKVRRTDVEDGQTYLLPTMTVVPPNSSELMLISNDDTYLITNIDVAFQRAATLVRPNINTILNIIEKVNQFRVAFEMDPLIGTDAAKNGVLYRWMTKRDVNPLPQIAIFVSEVDRNFTELLLKAAMTGDNQPEVRQLLTTRQTTPEHRVPDQFELNLSRVLEESIRSGRLQLAEDQEVLQQQETTGINVQDQSGAGPSGFVPVAPPQPVAQVSQVADPIDQSTSGSEYETGSQAHGSDISLGDYAWNEYPLPDGYIRPKICPPYIHWYPHGEPSELIDIPLRPEANVAQIPYEMQRIFSHEGMQYNVAVPWQADNHEMARRAYSRMNVERDDLDIAVLVDLVAFEAFIYGQVDRGYVEQPEANNQEIQFDAASTALFDGLNMPAVSTAQLGADPVFEELAPEIVPLQNVGVRDPFPGNADQPRAQQARRYCRQTHRQQPYHTGDHSYKDEEMFDISTRPDDISGTQDAINFSLTVVESSQEHVARIPRGIAINSHLVNNIAIPNMGIEHNERAEVEYWVPRGRKTARNGISVTFEPRRVKTTFAPRDAEKAVLTNGTINSRELFLCFNSNVRTDRKLIEQLVSRCGLKAMTYNNTGIYAKLWALWAKYHDAENLGLQPQFIANLQENIDIININVAPADAAATATRIINYDSRGVIYVPAAEMSPSTAMIMRYLASAQDIVAQVHDGVAHKTEAFRFPAIPVVVYSDAAAGEPDAALPAQVNITSHEIRAFIESLSNRFQEHDDCVAGYIWVADNIHGEYYQHGPENNREYYYMTNTYEVKTVELPRPSGTRFIFQVMEWTTDLAPKPTVLTPEYEKLVTAEADALRSAMAYLGYMISFGFSMIFAELNISGACINMSRRDGTRTQMPTVMRRLNYVEHKTGIQYIYRFAASIPSQIGAFLINAINYSGRKWNCNMIYLNAANLAADRYWQAQWPDRVPEMYNVYAAIAVCHNRPSVMLLPNTRPDVNTNPSVIMVAGLDRGYHGIDSDSAYRENGQTGAFWRFIPTAWLEINSQRMQWRVNEEYEIRYEAYYRAQQNVRAVQLDDLFQVRYNNDLRVVRFGSVFTYCYVRDIIIAPVLLERDNPDHRIVHYYTQRLVGASNANYVGVMAFHPPMGLAFYPGNDAVGDAFDTRPEVRKVRGRKTAGIQNEHDTVQRAAPRGEVPAQAPQAAPIPNIAGGDGEGPPVVVIPNQAAAPNDEIPRQGN